jgi:magnesium chelatase family protein
MSVTYLAQFILVCALNPCPCGYLTDPRKECHCMLRQIQQYMSRISGLLLDVPSARPRRTSRIDIQVEVPAVNFFLRYTTRRAAMQAA